MQSASDRRAGGQGTSPAVNVAVSSGPSLAVDPGIDGSTVADTFVYVTGNVQAPANSGITINGQLASFDRSSRFHAVVPLSAGSNTLEIILTTEDGQTTNQTISVVNNGIQPGMFTSDVNYGFAPLQATFRVEVQSGLVFQTAEFDLDGSGAFATVFQASALTYPYIDINATQTSPANIDLQQLDVLVNDERRPTPLAITGW